MELRVVQRRKKLGLTQGRLAELCDTTQQQIAKIESGVGDPQLSTLKRLAHALECEVKDLFYSKSEFVREILATVRREKLDLRKLSLVELNSICARSSAIPALHPYWELIRIKDNQIHIKEDL